jgi:hypothetical protein
MRCVQTVKGLSMDKRLCWGSMGVAGVLLLLFLVDVILRFFPALAPFMPFGGISIVVDVIGVIACGMVLYLSWDAYKDVR